MDKELRRTRVAKDGQPESLMQVKGGEEEPDWELVEQKRKGGKNKPLEKGTQEKKAMEEKKKPLEKGSGASSTTEKKGPLEKGTKIILKEAPPRPVVVVDWHNTLEKGDTVPVSHVNALKSLMEVANVHILSYVGSWAREQGVHLDIQSLIPSSLYHDLKGIHTTWHKTGMNGKAAWCKWLSASTIFDDDSSIIHECLDEGIYSFAIMTKYCHHDDTPSRHVFRDSPEAVEEFLETLP